MNLSFEEIYHSIFALLQDNIYISIVLGAILLYLAFRKPKLFLSLLLIATVLTAVTYVISHISATSVETKDEMIKVKTLTQ